MGVTQRLYFFGNELKKIIDKFQPDEIAVEETILVRGPKIMRTLARFSGAALFLAYSYQKREIQSFEPSSWKKGLGLKGDATKPEIQLKVCDVFKLIEKDKILEYEKKINELIIKENEVRKGNKINVKEQESKIKELEKKLKKMKSELKIKERQSQKTRGISSDDIHKNVDDFEQFKIATEEAEKNLNQIKLDYKTKKKDRNSALREVEKGLEKISMDIYSDSGINQDVADSIGVTIKAINEQKK